MTDDEQEIRQLVSSWIAASKAGDVEKVLSLMADDVVFLAAGRPPMDKSEFAAAAHAQASKDAPHFDGSNEIQEIRVFGDWAYLWQNLTVVATPPDGGPPVTRAGNTLTIFTKLGNRWLLARDANMLAPSTDDASKPA